jgi:hypothetical protein
MRIRATTDTSKRSKGEQILVGSTSKEYRLRARRATLS